MRSVALRTTSRSRWMGMAQNSSSTPARISTSTVQAVQVTIFSSERCEGKVTSSHCAGSPGMRERKVL